MRLFSAALASAAALVAGTAMATADELSTPASHFSTLASLQDVPDAAVVMTAEEFHKTRGGGSGVWVPTPNEEAPDFYIYFEAEKKLVIDIFELDDGSASVRLDDTCLTTSCY